MQICQADIFFKSCTVHHAAIYFYEMLHCVQESALGLPDDIFGSWHTVLVVGMQAFMPANFKHTFNQAMRPNACTLKKFTKMLQLHHFLVGQNSRSRLAPTHQMQMVSTPLSCQLRNNIVIVIIVIQIGTTFVQTGEGVVI